MSVEKRVEACSAAVLERGLDDWVHAPEVAWVCRSVGGASEGGEVRDLSIEVIKNVLTRGWMTIGDVTLAGYALWPLDVEQSSQCVERA